MAYFKTIMVIVGKIKRPTPTNNTKSVIKIIESSALGSIRKVRVAFIINHEPKTRLNILSFVIGTKIK